jgi:AraC-like DNA-binding protein
MVPRPSQDPKATRFVPSDLLRTRVRPFAEEDIGITALFRALHSDLRFAPSLERAARLALRSPSTFKRHLHLLSGRNWRQFLGEWRLQNARRLLSNPLTNVKAVAFTVGYRSAASFTRAFHRRFGVSPSIYRGRVISRP